jgi:hypothetical protein
MANYLNGLLHKGNQNANPPNYSGAALIHQLIDHNVYQAYRQLPLIGFSPKVNVEM